MKPMTGLSLAASVALALAACESYKSENKMSFFVTSTGPGKGADLGGLAGADRHCQALAESAGAGGKTWRAYLSATGVNARDRIGNGPWQNAKGVVVATSVDNLHGANNLGKQTSLNEKGQPVNGSGDTPNMHDMLTGSTPDGRAIGGGGDSTCSDWTTSGAGAAMLGHHDRRGLRDDAESRSWNSSHLSRPSKTGDPGCSQVALRGSGGNGLFYCFAVD
ncbi:MAG TPA: hypothetical protein VJO54_08865 [Burkholderiales bacterium]|nr:hypothetical protein [Burkholderiales bacterium]